MKFLFKRNRRFPFTLVLSGGGARGLAHIGALKALEKHNFIPDLIVGTSMGAVVGGMYAQLKSAQAVEAKVRKFLQSDYFKKIGLEQFSEINNKSKNSLLERFTAHLKKRYLISKTMLSNGAFARTTLLESMRMLLDECEIQALPIRFAAVACDLISGEEILFTDGSIIIAVTASSAVPGIVAPIEYNSRLLIDGTVTSTIPIHAARLLSKNLIIAVDVRKNLGNFENPNHGYQTLLRSNDITSRALNNLYLKQADCVLAPDVGFIKWNEFYTINQCIKAGEQTVEENLHQIDKLLRKSFFSFFHKS